MCIPLVTRLIIDDLVAVRASVEGDTSATPRPVGATIGLAIGFLVMMMSVNTLATHSMTRATLIGFKTRAAVGFPCRITVSEAF